MIVQAWAAGASFSIALRTAGGRVSAKMTSTGTP